MMPQDTLRLKQTDETNLTGQKQDTIARKDTDTLKTTLHGKKIEELRVISSETVTTKNRVKTNTLLKELSTAFSNKKTSDLICYYTSDVSLISPEQTKIYFPYTLIETSKKTKNELETRISSVTKDGIKFEKNYLKSDWMLPVILFSLLIYLIMRREFSDFMRLLKKFLTFRTTRDSGTTKASDFSSILIDLTSYINISLFCYTALIFFNISTGEIKEYYAFMIIFTSVIFLSLARYSVIFITGAISEQKDIFTEYSRVITCFYRSTSLILFFILIILLYSNLFQPKLLIYSGFLTVIFLYVVRMINLSLIFIRRNASILYLILYLCALELLPVAVFIKYLQQLLQHI